MMAWGSVAEWRKGPWTPEEDKLLVEYVNFHGEGRWSSVAKAAGLNRSGKSCRLRWVNYLRPGLKKGQITPQEEGIIIELHALWGNKWSTIARYLPGRTDNEIKNYWRTHFKKKEKSSQKQAKRKAQLLKLKQQQQQKQVHPLEDDENKFPPYTEAGAAAAPEAPPQGRHEMVFMNPSLEDHCMSMPMMTVPHQQEAAAAPAEVDDGILWGGLWNMDDGYHTSNCNKIALQNQQAAMAYSGFGGDLGTLWNGGYIF